MPYRLHNRVGSGGFVVEAALALAGVDFELEEHPSQAGTPLPESFRETNPWRQVPTLVLPEGEIMTETSAILIHLAARHPALGPPPGSAAHARFLRWIVFANVNIYEAVARRVYPDRYVDDPAAMDAVRSAATRRMGDALATLDRAIAPGPYLLGDGLSVADVYFAMLLIWFRGAVRAPQLARLMENVRGHAVIGPIWRRHFGERHAMVRLNGP